MCVLWVTHLHRYVCGQCPWSRSADLLDLHSDCICGYNNVQRLTIQCSPVNFTQLMTAIHLSVQKMPIDMLYINNSTLTTIPGGVFKNLDVLNLHISNSKLETISLDAFNGLEDKLMTLSIQNTQIKQLPHLQIQKLRALKSLDLSNNKLVSIESNAFANMQLTTIKLSDNNITLSDHAFHGLESTLKNLNLKATNLQSIPTAIGNLSSLAFLDLAQNKIKDIAPDLLLNLHSLTAINLERNQIERLHHRVFAGVNDSLSSLSLLNNLLVHFPSDAISQLTGLRVLDLGFNAIQEIPFEAFRDNTLLTLLALDGNPLHTIPFEAFQHLNSTLRGLSIGGKHLECDCRLRWIIQWISEHNLQVTSRERNPQFCGKPDNLRRKSFLSINESEMICEESMQTSHQMRATEQIASSSSTTIGPQTTADSHPEDSSPVLSASSLLKVHSTHSNDTTNGSVYEVMDSTPMMTTTLTPTSKGSEIVKKSPLSRAMFGSDSIKIIDAFFHNNSISIEWEPIKSNNAGYQVVYRFFGSRDFKKGPLMTTSQRRYKTPTIPSNECVVICVISLEDHSYNKLNNIPLNQCRELRRDGNRISDLDKIVIAVSAAVCVFVIFAVFIFSCCYHKSNKSTKTTTPLTKSDHEWETVSVYSTRSIPRARMYHMDTTVNNSQHNLVLDDTRSHISNCYQTTNPYMKHRSIADGQSNRSYSMARNSHSIGDNPELTKSHQSLSALSRHQPYNHNNNNNNSHKKHRKKGHHNRLISTNSLHSLTEYESDWNYGSHPRIANNWKDNALDIYVDQNYVISTNGRNKYLK
ncbi:unnamed protein product [Oppiella nova]|uniref:Uncharacterized protein n=1 Tax=Oppiella nova TaxID=334625 RepID=A0A7R9Q8X2_9ACAR|nr:unnamed protein product [Oppiella nova]CAG2158575.1 unnamed protein product [Oppiella nova]